MVTKNVGTLILLLSFGFCIAWREIPSLPLCCLFWGTMAVGQVLRANYPLLPGMFCNCLATVANGGYMPVYGTEVYGGIDGIHIQGSSYASLQFLCDRFAACSIGDMLILIGLLTMIVMKLGFPNQPEV